MSPSKSAVNRNFLPLLLPVSLYLILSLLYLIIIPAGESPDEPGHLLCIEQVAIEGQLPISRSTVSEEIDWWARENILSEYMCYHMPAYYVLGGYIVRVVAFVNGDSLHYAFPPANNNFTNNASSNNAAMFEKIPHISIWQTPQPLTLLSLRLLAIVLGSSMVLGTWLIAQRVFAGNQWIALLAAVLVAGWPQFLFISRAISNDTLATALAVSVLVILTNTGKPERFKWAAMLAALAVLTKLSVAFVVIVTFVVWIIELIWLSRERKTYWNALVYMVLIWGVTAAFMRLTPTIWENWQYSLVDFGGANDTVYTIAYWQQVYAWTLSSGWAWFGWLSLRPTEWHAQLWWFFIQITGLSGVYIAIKKTNSKRNKILLLTLAIWTIAVFLSYIKVTANRWQPQFRFALSVLPVLVTFAAGNLFLVKKERWQKFIPVFVATVLFAYNLWLLFAIIQPAYQ